MRVKDKMKLKEDVAQELSRSFHPHQIDGFLSEFKVSYSFINPAEHGVKPYVDDRLSNISTDELIRMADELDMKVGHLVPPSASPKPSKPAHDSSPANAFISHLAIGKIGAINLSDALQEYNIQGFVAHEDIEPSKQWQDEIEKALNKMDFFISLHTKGFSQSVWCQQEVGFAVAKGVEIVSIKFDEDPAGFIGKYQALAGTNNIVNDITNIFNILQNSSKTKDLYSAKIADKVAQKPIETLADKYKI